MTTSGHTFNRECEERKGKSIDNLSIDYHGQSLYKWNTTRISTAMEKRLLDNFSFEITH